MRCTSGKEATASPIYLISEEEGGLMGECQNCDAVIESGGLVTDGGYYVCENCVEE